MGSSTMLEGSVDRPVKGFSPGGQLQQAVTVTTNVMWTLYRSYFSGVVAHVVPEHTRDACFQLFCDLRANTPKDRRFLQRHARAFTPLTLPGWLAMASALSFSLSGLGALACVTIALSIAGVWSLVGVVIASGVFMASVLTVLAFSLFVAALVTGAMASGALMMYIAASTTVACLRLVSRLMLGGPAPQPQPPALPQAQEQATGNNSSSGSEQQQNLALPNIRIKSPRKSNLCPVSGPDSPDAAAASPRKLNPAAAAAAALGEPSTSAPAVAPAVLGATSAASNLRPSPFHSELKNGADASSNSSSPRTSGSFNGSAEQASAIKASGALSPHTSNSSTAGDGGGTPPPAAPGAPRTPSAAAADTKAGSNPISGTTAA